MDYIPRKVTGITLDEINDEIRQMAWNEYCHGGFDRPRLWDLLEAKRQLETGNRKGE